MSEVEAYLRYKRSRFSMRLHKERLYTAAHQWLWQRESDLYCVGLTKFALRMLGDPVEFEFEVQASARVECGQVLGWLEGFKAVTDVFCPLDGTFAGTNPALDQEITLLSSAPYEDGWLFAVRGTAGAGVLDAQGYTAVLDGTIDRMTGAAG